MLSHTSKGEFSTQAREMCIVSSTSSSNVNVYGLPTVLTRLNRDKEDEKITNLL